MQRLSILACQLGTVALAGFLTLGCGGGKSGAGVDAGPGAGGMSGGGGSSEAGGASGGSSSGGSGGAGGSSGTGGAVGTGGSSGASGAVGTGGSSTASTSCDAFDACGGSVVGVWKHPATMLCGPSLATLANCPDYTATGNTQQGGTLTFRADGSYLSVKTTDGTQSIAYPSTCAGGSACTHGTVGTDGGLSGTCWEDPPGSCHCDYVYSNEVLTQEGTYTTTATTIAMAYPGSSPDAGPMDYCVQGNTLMLHYSAGGYDATAAFTKQ